MVTTSTVRRARSAESKERRAADLAGAAGALATSLGLRNVTLAAIAEDAGVHPSAVRRYFDSREDILLTLAAEACRTGCGRIGGGGQAPGSTHRRRELLDLG
jgi:AcrR family transcriptional regulator